MDFITMAIGLILAGLSMITSVIWSIKGRKLEAIYSLLWTVALVQIATLK